MGASSWAGPGWRKEGFEGSLWRVFLGFLKITPCKTSFEDLQAYLDSLSFNMLATSVRDKAGH